MYQLTQRLIASLSLPMVSTQRPIRLRRFAITSVFALLSLATYKAAPAQAQDASDQLCYGIADNKPPNAGGGDGSTFPDVLSSFDLDANVNEATFIAGVTRPDDSPVSNIEALSSRPRFGDLIAANGNELGVVDPLTGEFDSIGFIEGFVDFDAIVIDRTGNQNQLLAVAKGPRGNEAANNIIQVTLAVSQGEVTGIASQQELSIASNFPNRTQTIDGIAISDSGEVFAVANGGTNTPQRLVEVNTATGVLTDRGPFLNEAGERIPDIEDLSFDLRGRLFATTGSSPNVATRETGYIYADPSGGDDFPAAIDEISLVTPEGAVDYEASACLQRPEAVEGELLLVKRITAITRNGQPIQRFESFDNQGGTQVDNRMRSETDQAFPLGIVEAPNALQPGDEVEYTVYLFNPSEATFENVILCDPIRRPSVLQPDSIQFVDATDDFDLEFVSASDFRRTPLTTADDACVAALNGGDTFLSGPPGPTGRDGTGGGVVTNQIVMGPGEISVTRFTIEVGAVQEGADLDNGEIPDADE